MSKDKVFLARPERAERICFLCNRKNPTAYWTVYGVQSVKSVHIERENYRTALTFILVSRG